MKNLLFITFLLFLSSCVETIIVGSIATTTVLTREKTIGQSREDVVIASRVLKNFSKKDLESNFSESVNVTVNEKRVLLTGMVGSSKVAKKAVKLAWKAKGVKEVINEIEVVNDRSLIKNSTRYVKDSVITSNIKSQIALSKKLSSKNAKITTVNGSVYLLGVAESDSEIHKMSYLISKVKGVKKVVSHLILIDDQRRKG